MDSFDPRTKVVIFCGGQGTRLREITESLPKPLVPVGDKPILWHIMKGYASQGIKNFVLCLGYKGELIRDFFINYYNYASDVTVNLKEGKILRPRNFANDDWNVTLVNTGETTNTAHRLFLVRRYLENDPYFMVTYGDGVSDVDLEQLFAFHMQNKTVGTITGINPTSKYGELTSDGQGLINSFEEKPLLENSWINGGFMVFKSTILNHPLLRENVAFENVLMDLAGKKQLSMYKHRGFWHCMDTPRDYGELNELWKGGEAPWKRW